MKTGTRNLITDVAGFKVGNAQDDRIKTGVSVLLADASFTAAVHVMGGAPGTRETDLLAPDRLVQKVDALVLSGGSAFGLDAASGVADALARSGRGFQVKTAIIPIVPSAILFDLLNGGQKDWADNPYKALGAAALAAAEDGFALGSVGAGTGATTATLKGGLGSASLVFGNGYTVAALVAVNSLGSVVVPGRPNFWAAPFEVAGEYGGKGVASPSDPLSEDFSGTDHLPGTGHNTTIAIVATDADLTQAQLHRMAIAAHDGMARAIVPAHTPFDGDLVFAASSGRVPLKGGDAELLALGHAASLCLSRAIARGVYLATAASGDKLPCWQEKFS
jgi:L-aminopeptidase/D-esterase-like protein